MRHHRHPGPPRPADWAVTTTWQHGRRIIRPGDRLTITGKRGATFRFLQHVRTAQGKEWIDVVGGARGNIAWRSFRPDRIGRVLGTP